LTICCASRTPLFEDATETHLPPHILMGPSMDAAPIDVDRDRDVDLLVAIEHWPNLLLINDGTGHFTDESASRIPQHALDSEDIGIGDFDRDGDLDIVVVSEDDGTNEMYFNDGTDHFTDESHRWPVDGTSNAVAVGDIDRDGDLDIVVGNNGQNELLLNDGKGAFVVATATHLPAIMDVTQDVDLGDVDRDGDLDLLVGNEDRNRLLINDRGVFTDQTEERLPGRSGGEETREADFGDADGDGDLDIVFANTQFFVQNANRRNRLLINNGRGTFTDQTEDRLPGDVENTIDIDFVDVDGDRDLDLVLGNVPIGASGDRLGAPYRIYLNDGRGTFEIADWALPYSIVGYGFDIEAADFDKDGRIDLYLCSRIGLDRLALGKDAD